MKVWTESVKRAIKKESMINFTSLYLPVSEVYRKYSDYKKIHVRALNFLLLWTEQLIFTASKQASN
jgi:hypothetical protein